MPARNLVKNTSVKSSARNSKRSKQEQSNEKQSSRNDDFSKIGSGRRKSSKSIPGKGYIKSWMGKAQFNLGGLNRRRSSVASDIALKR